MEETRGGVMAEHTDKQTNGLIEEPAELFTVVTVSYPRSSLAGGARCHWIKAPTIDGDRAGDGDQEHCWYLLGSDGSGYHWQDVVLGAEQVTVEARPALDRAVD